ncbi:MAG: ABC transporter substrate-binding protein [Gammaproteobacteria bacterium]|nr:ABC transporter substrate-binding protein [Gammaproteobacteria bacterium]
MVSKLRIALLPMLLCLPLTASADEAAQALVVDNTKAVLDALRANREQVASDPQYVQLLVTEKIVPHLDFQVMTLLVVGKKHWQNADAAQRKTLTDEFRTLLLRTYSKSLAEYRDQRIEFLPYQPSAKKDRAVVRSKFYPTGGQPVAVDYRLRNKDGWRIYDIKIDGISLVKNFQSSFAAEIEQSGIDGLIASLEAKNQVLETQ